MDGKRGGVPRGAAGVQAPRGQHDIQKTVDTHTYVLNLLWVATAARTCAAGAAQHRKKIQNKKPSKKKKQKRQAAGALTEATSSMHTPIPLGVPQPTLSRPKALNQNIRGA